MEMNMRGAAHALVLLALIQILSAPATAARAGDPGDGFFRETYVFHENVSLIIYGKGYWYTATRFINISCRGSVVAEISSLTVYGEASSRDIEVFLRTSNMTRETDTLYSALVKTLVAPATLGYMYPGAALRVSLVYSYSYTTRIKGVPAEKLGVEGRVDSYRDGVHTASIRIEGYIALHLLTAHIVEARLSYTGWSYTNTNTSINRLYTKKLLGAEADKTISRGDAAASPYVFIAWAPRGSRVVVEGVPGSRNVTLINHGNGPAVVLVLGAENELSIGAANYTLNVMAEAMASNTSSTMYLPEKLVSPLHLETRDYIEYDPVTAAAVAAALIVFLVIPAVKLASLARRHSRPRFKGGKWLPRRSSTVLSDRGES